jgi:cell division protein FtsW
VLVALEKHLSCIIILGMLGVAMMFAAGSRLRYLGLFGALGTLGISALALFTDYTKRRILIWQNPAAYPLDGGWQTLQGMMAIGSGGFFGLGLGNSRLKYSYVSEPQNDFIFTITCEELGLVGAVLILALFAAFLWRGYTVAMRASDAFSSLVVFGIVTKVTVQVLLNVAVVTNTIPNTGISLPFFSYGGSSLVMLFAEMGLLLSCTRHAHIRT